jgi:uncharacterized membrane protein (UPF0127 family)
VVVVSVDDTDLEVLVADTLDERRQGLKEVSEVPDGADGMLFSYATPSFVTYGMLDVVIPLDIWFFGPDGALIGTTEMAPCPAEPCTDYGSPGEVSWVLETPAGVFDFPIGAVLSGAPSGESG